MLDEDTAMLVVAYPNFFGQIDDFSGLAQAVHDAGALLCMVVDPIALGLFKSPGELGADIVVGEGQPLGIPLSFGGPYLGFFATRKKHVRQIAGRIVGETVDKHGVGPTSLTLRPREQDIRREGDEQHLHEPGPDGAGGLRLRARWANTACARRRAFVSQSHYAAEQIDALEGYSVDRSKPFFKEFVVTCPRPVAELNEYLFDHWGIIGGYDLGQITGSRNQMLIAVTEMNTKEDRHARRGAARSRRPHQASIRTRRGRCDRWELLK